MSAQSPGRNLAPGSGVLFWEAGGMGQTRAGRVARNRPREEPLNVSSPAVTSVHRVHNFNAGPSALPLSVLERIREELLDWRGSGMSVMEMSHRSPEFESINAAAEAGLRKHLSIPDANAVLFLQRGGSMQFTMVPLNRY